MLFFSSYCNYPHRSRRFLKRRSRYCGEIRRANRPYIEIYRDRPSSPFSFWVEIDTYQGFKTPQRLTPSQISELILMARVYRHERENWKREETTIFTAKFRHRQDAIAFATEAGEFLKNSSGDKT